MTRRYDHFRSVPLRPLLSPFPGRSLLAHERLIPYPSEKYVAFLFPFVPDPSN